MHPSTAARRLHLGPSHSQGHTLQQARGVHRQPCGLTGVPCLWFTSAVSGAALLSMSFCPLGYLGHIFMVIPEVQEKSKWKQAVLNGKAQNCHAFIANHTLLVKRGYVSQSEEFRRCEILMDRASFQQTFGESFDEE